MYNKNNNYIEQPQKDFKPWRAAIYIRLSKEDGDKSESNSITNQRNILMDYLSQQRDIEFIGEYSDDGESGATADRPDFQRMLVDIDTKKINCIIVKNLSRFSRNMGVTINFITEYFPEIGLRFISLDPKYDSAIDDIGEAEKLLNISVHGFMNESYLATTSSSIKKTLDTNRKKGLFIGSFAPYGYLKDPGDRHRLIVNEETAEVVRTIFKKYSAGESILGITKYLNNTGIPNPSTYKKMNEPTYCHGSSNINDGLWSDKTVRRILQNEMYIGNMVQGKNKKISYKKKKCKATPRDKWYIVENTHQAIIDNDLFCKVQERFNSGSRSSPVTNRVDLFSGLVCCADCGRIMSKNTKKNSNKTYVYYKCTTSKKLSPTACTSHTIRADELENTVLKTIQGMINIAIEQEEALKIIEKSSKRKTEFSSLESNRKKLLSEQEKIKLKLFRLYDNREDGIINDEQFCDYKSIYSKQSADIDNQIKAIDKQLEEYKTGYDCEAEHIKYFKNHGNIDSLNRAIVTELIDLILVYEGGRIKINFKFDDIFKKVDEYIKLNTDILEEESKKPA